MARRRLRSGWLGVALTAAAGVVTVGMATPAVAAPVPSGSERDGFACEMTRTGEFPTAAPAAVELDPVKLAEALNYASVMGSTSVKVFRHGCLVAEGTRDRFQERVPVLQAGQTKMIVALVAGIVADRGWVSLDAPIGTYLPEGLGDEAHRAVTLRQFMQLTSGVQVNHVQGLNFFADNSRAREYYSMEFEHEPGTYFEFDETTPSVVTDVLQRVIDAHEPGLDFQDFTQRELVRPARDSAQRLLLAARSFRHHHRLLAAVAAGVGVRTVRGVAAVRR